MNPEQKDRLRKELFEHAAESIIAIDKTGIIKLVNPATEKLFGYSQEELTGKTVEYLMPERYSKRHVKHRDDYNQNPRERSMGIGMDLYARRKDGSEFPVEISLSPFESDGNSFVIGFIIDITKRKQIEDEIKNHQKKLEALTVELKASNERLEAKVIDRTKVLQEALTEIEKSRTELSEALEKEKDLNELKSRFLSMASHEFRTPLTTILSSASLIPEYPTAEQQQNRLKHVDRIKSAVNNLNDILGDFLSLSKIEEGKIEASYKKFNLRSLAEEICGELKGICKEGQTILLSYNGDVNVELDIKLVRNIIINLLSNALKFSDENKNIFINISVNSELITIEIKDEGIGISDDDKKHLFERFFRGHNATNVQGTGLGLNIVSRYVELMNGHIRFESQPEKGTTFTITFSNGIH